MDTRVALRMPLILRTQEEQRYDEVSLDDPRKRGLHLGALFLPLL